MVEYNLYDYTFEQVREMVNGLSRIADRKETLVKLERAAKLAGQAGVFEYIRSLVPSKPEPKKPVTVNPVTLPNPYIPYPPQQNAMPTPAPNERQNERQREEHWHAVRLRRIFDSGYRFQNCDDPDGCRSFCEPWGPASNTPHERWSEGQNRMFNFIDRHYRETVEIPSRVEGVTPKAFVENHGL